MGSLSNVVALVSGGASGLGYASIRRILAHGGRAVLADLSSSSGAEVAKRLNDQYSEERCIFAETDVSCPDAVAQAVKQTEKLGHLNTIVNCAGLAYAIKTYGKKGCHPLEAFNKTLTVNVAGSFNMIRLGVEKMCTSEGKLNENDRGVVINTASVAAFEGQTGQVAYSASKGAIVSMTLPLARDLSTWNIRVNTIAPGLFDTALLADLPEKVKLELAKDVPYPQRLGKPDEYAQLVHCIIENEMINGETIRLDGAIRMKP